MTRMTAFALFVIIAATLSSQSQAQDIFGGRGVRALGSEPADYSSIKRSANQRIIGQTTDTPESTNPIRSWWDKVKPKSDKPIFSMPEFSMPSFSQSSAQQLAPGETRASKFFRGLTQRPSWLPQRDPTEPSMLEKFNQKSKAFVDKTAGWFKGKSDSLTQQGTASWDTIKREMQSIQADENRESNSRIFPNLRSARSSSGSGIR